MDIWYTIFAILMDFLCLFEALFIHFFTKNIVKLKCESVNE